MSLTVDVSAGIEKLESLLRVFLATLGEAKDEEAVDGVTAGLLAANFDSGVEADVTFSEEVLVFFFNKISRGQFDSNLQTA